jgi:hypothetical protein
MSTELLLLRSSVRLPEHGSKVVDGGNEVRRRLDSRYPHIIHRTALAVRLDAIDLVDCTEQREFKTSSTMAKASTPV